MQASRKPRRAFAAPLVMIAAVPACIFTSSDPKQPEVREHRNPPGKQPPGPQPIDPDQPDHPDRTTSDRREWKVFQRSDDASCWAHVEVQCPEPDENGMVATCNPPPAQPIACPTGIRDGVELTVYSAGEGQPCYVMPPPASCPENATCNPPPPRETACPGAQSW